MLYLSEAVTRFRESHRVWEEEGGRQGHRHRGGEDRGRGHRARGHRASSGGLQVKRGCHHVASVSPVEGRGVLAAAAVT